MISDLSAGPVRVARGFWEQVQIMIKYQWVSYGGDARIWLPIFLLVAAGGVILAGIRLPLPVRTARPGLVGRGPLIFVWLASIPAFLVALTIYLRLFIHDYGVNTLATEPKDPVAPITFTAVVAVFIIIVISCRSAGIGTRLAGAAIGAIAAPMIFELPFDLIVMARTYPSIPPDPALYRALFFAPLFLIEITTLLLLRQSSMVRLTRATFFSFALMLGVFAVWALSGFGYPSAPLPPAPKIVSKIRAFVTPAPPARAAAPARQRRAGPARVYRRRRREPGPALISRSGAASRLPGDSTRTRRTVMATHTTIDSPIGELTLVADDGKLTGVYFPHHWYKPDPATFGPESGAGFEEATEQLAG